MNKIIKVLMVDDEEQFRKTTKKILEKKGFETIMAENGRQAIDMLKEKPDVVVLDIKMEGMDGHETLDEIKKRSPDLPVIMLTGHGALPSAKEALTQGAFDYLSKPCDIDLLASKIKDACKFKFQDDVDTEKKVSDIMIPLNEYTLVEANQTIEEAVKKLKDSFLSKVATSRLMETGHRSILVTGKDKSILGLLTILDLLNAIMPGYLSAPRPSTADSVRYSPMFWTGMFTRETLELKKIPISQIMSPAPITIDEDANIMEAAHTIIEFETRRLLVISKGKPIGIVREQDLFFEMERIMSSQ
ncbi:MAG: response regulator [Proteobacteria bacterium]|nr:response regulator [Pseudomonadota bacterium]